MARLLATLNCLIILGSALTLYRICYQDSTLPRHVVKTVKTTPWKIEPRYDFHEAISDQQLKRLLNRMKPPKHGSTNQLLHALRFWGPEVVFEDSDRLSGKELLQYFLDDRVFRKIVGNNQPPLFNFTELGIKVRSWNKKKRGAKTASHHQDDILATLAESGVPLNTNIITRSGTFTVGELLENSLNQFHLDTFEYEWTIIGYARYLFPTKRWTNRYGTTISIETLIDELTAHPHGIGPCNGLHRLEALVVIYRAFEQTGGLKPTLKNKILDYLTEVSRLLIQSQSREGSWDRKWMLSRQHSNQSNRQQASTADRILVTGHHLEWLALAPPEVLPPREHLLRACHWLANRMETLDQKTLTKAYGPFSHAIRALCLWRKMEPYTAWQKFNR